MDILHKTATFTVFVKQKTAWKNLKGELSYECGGKAQFHVFGMCNVIY